MKSKTRQLRLCMRYAWGATYPPASHVLINNQLVYVRENELSNHLITKSNTNFKKERIEKLFNSLNVDQVKQLLKYNELFDGKIGLVKYFTCNIPLQRNFIPFNSKCYQIPYKQISMVKAEIQKLLN